MTEPECEASLSHWRKEIGAHSIGYKTFMIRRRMFKFSENVIYMGYLQDIMALVISLVMPLLSPKNRTYKPFILSGSDPQQNFQEWYYSVTLTFCWALKSSLVVPLNSRLSRTSYSSLQSLFSQFFMFQIFHIYYKSVPFLCHIHYDIELF